ncbi:hypothetical protein RIE95_07100 [Acidithiobacillus thiooxidans]|uniref:hypothetical protein n=1 Tax=Acidithiobacillus thiooxidans TaxID=930 RepID=UPI0028647444|nr:hypothetical protein [Acidithiobacillus thiooxidans]MDR7926753.1 hypothetical protein [Acidithiobacillus thiooxidans]
MVPKSQKMVGECFICNQFADIGEGKPGPSLDDMAALGVGRDPVGVNPGQGRGEQAEMEVVGDGISGPVLAAGAPDFLFDFFEASPSTCLSVPDKPPLHHALRWIYSRSTATMRDCHPSPVCRK